MTVQTNWKDDYLAEMGITRWYPRVHLVNALPTVVKEITQTVPDAVAAVSPTAELKNAAEPVENEPNKLRLNAVETTTQMTPEAGPSVKATAAVAKTETVKFGLGIYVIGDYLVASSLVTNHEALQEQAWRLLQNVLRSIGQPETPLIYHHSIFWPFFQNKNADQSLTSAKTYVDDFIRHLSEEHKVTKIVAFGGVLPKLKDWSPSSTSYKPDQHLVLPSLYKMLQNPSEKAKAWQLIKASPLANV